MRDLHDNVVIVTGSSSGIGEAVARAFAAEGCKLIVNSSSSVEAGELLAKSLPDAVYVQGDISKEADCDKLVAAAMECYGHLDVLVNNAGTTKVIPHRDIQAAGEEVWRPILDVNVLGTWLMSRAAAPWLAQYEGGCIINVSSVAGLRPGGSSIPYACSKAAVNHMTRLLAKVLGPEGRVNAVAPGLIDPPGTAGWDTPKTNTEKMAPPKRVGTVDGAAH